MKAGGAAEEHRVHAKQTEVLDARIHLLPSAAPGAVQRGEEASRGAITARGLLTGPVRFHAWSAAAAGVRPFLGRLPG